MTVALTFGPRRDGEVPNAGKEWFEWFKPGYEELVWHSWAPWASRFFWELPFSPEPIKASGGTRKKGTGRSSRGIAVAATAAGAIGMTVTRVTAARGADGAAATRGARGADA